MGAEITQAMTFIEVVLMQMEKDSPQRGAAERERYDALFPEIMEIGGEIALTYLWQQAVELSELLNERYVA